MINRARSALHRIVWLCQIFWWRNYTFVSQNDLC